MCKLTFLPFVFSLLYSHFDFSVWCKLTSLGSMLRRMGCLASLRAQLILQCPTMGRYQSLSYALHIFKILRMAKEAAFSISKILQSNVMCFVYRWCCMSLEKELCFLYGPQMVFPGVGTRVQHCRTGPWVLWDPCWGLMRSWNIWVVGAVLSSSVLGFRYLDLWLNAKL